ncbi:hypothetical protein [Aureimonas leprariae]|uniref:hypothetical protein n=1 Tax=Plantimonas leprariae TaxID=2615207 RepID=UPI001386B6BC|nr:hypothetical protein [Aureimonas leprariae]
MIVADEVRERLERLPSEELERMARHTIRPLMLEIERRGGSLILRSEEFVDPVPDAAE